MQNEITAQPESIVITGIQGKEIDDQQGLKREIGLLGLSANIANIMIGAGIFVLPAIVAAGLGTVSILAYLFCGFLITLVMLCFAEVGSRITDSGGAFIYIEAAFGKFPGFITAILFILSALAADAAIANAVADIIGMIIPAFQGSILKIGFMLVLFYGLAYVNILGVRRGIGFVKIILIFKVAPLLLILFLGTGEISIANFSPGAFPTIRNIGEVSLVLFFAFQGAESALSVSGEVRNPNKVIPQAIRLSIIFVLLIYILIHSVSQGVLGPALPDFRENPLGEVASRIFGPVGFSLLTIGAAVSMFGTLTSTSLSLPRVLYAAAKERVIPIRLLSTVHDKYATPYISILVYTSLGLFFALAGGFKQMAIISSASILLIYLGVSLATIKLRRRNKADQDKRYFRIRGGYTVPVLSVLVIVWFLSNLTRNEMLGIGIFILLLSLFYILIKPEELKNLLRRIGKSKTNH
jgi:basic amino acid/polyamine antiporter, APA family